MRTGKFVHRGALAGALALTIGMGAGFATARPSGRCERHGPDATRVTRGVLVYGQDSTEPGPYGSFPTTYYACARPGGPSLQLGVDAFTGKYGSEDSTSDIVIAGPFVAALRSHGEADYQSCGDPVTMDHTGCPQPSYWIRVLNVTTRRQTNIAGGAGDSALALSNKAAVAWLFFPQHGPAQLEATLLRPQGASGFSASPITIDTGNIERRSLRFVGRTIHWVRDGRRHQRTLS